MVTRVLLVVLALLLCACGGGDDDDDAASTSMTSATSATTSVTGLENDPDLATEAAAVVAEAGVPAFAIARLAGGGAVTIGVAGTRSHDSDVELAVDAPWHLGSDTKAMTAVLLATFVEDGELDLDSPLGDLFTDIEMDPVVAAVTLRDVLGHRAGLDDSALDLGALHAATDSSVARAGAVRDALQRPGITPGEFAYANVDYMLAGELAERLGGDTWEHLITERVFTPLGMTCGFGAPVGPTVPLGHTADGEPVPDDADVTDNSPAFGPTGTVRCTMAEWASFAGAVLAGLRGEDSAVLAADTVADLFDDDHDYVAGWARGDVDGVTVYTHDGSNTLWYCRAVLAIERNEALLLASNTGEASAVTAMDVMTEEFLTG